MSTLYILGNGFDLAHGLPTAYYPNLTKILNKQNSKLFKEITDMFFKQDITLWKDFESRIGNVQSDDSLV